MWLGVKQAARRKKERPALPDLGTVRNELGDTQDAIRYRRLFSDHPSVERGPDQTIADHFARLKRADQEFQAGQNPDAERRQNAQQKGMLRAPAPDAAPDLSMPWVGGLPAASPVSDLKGMPQRIPGWFTGDALDAAPPDYGTPPMSRRTPGAGYSPNYAPPRSTREEWMRGLADKGIFLDSDGRRMSPEQMQLPHRPVRGHDIWDSFTRPAPGRHRAAQVVIAYIKSATAEENFEEVIARQQKRHKMMEDDGWTFRESGGGNGWEKRVGDKTHRIISDNALNRDGGYDHGYTYYPPGGTPKFYTDLHDAVRHSRTGQTQSELSITKKKPNAIEDSSYHPERDERTRPMGQLRPPRAKGTYQTLSSWSDEA